MRDLKNLRSLLEKSRSEKGSSASETAVSVQPVAVSQKPAKKKVQPKRPEGANAPTENMLRALEAKSSRAVLHRAVKDNKSTEKKKQEAGKPVDEKCPAPEEKRKPVSESRPVSGQKREPRAAVRVQVKSSKLKQARLSEAVAAKTPKEPAIRNIPGCLDLAEELPVSERAEEIAEAILANQVVIVSGETGSGKTTQLPKICMRIGRGCAGLIGHTQPRRIAATSIAKRISEEMKSEPGTVAGYKIRFKDNIEPGASIKLMTDGILLAETQSDPLLRAYDTIIIDEAHERSLNIDFLLGYLREILPKRPDLKVIITSATIDSERFAKHFEGVNGKPVPVINVSGRLYPVQVRYRPIDEDEDESDDRTLMNAISNACDELMMAGRGDILVFLPGEREIREAGEVLRKNNPRGVDVLPLFSRLSIEDQDKIFKGSGQRRIILATNIAETSLTVPGIRFVVDTGLARVKRYSYRNKVEQLQIEPVSQAAAAQRAGRCGRVANGICIRLYDELDFERRPKYTDPEILRSSLATVILRMKSLHLSDVRSFPFVEAPPARAIADGYDQLLELNAVSARGSELTDVGRQLARLPLDAKVARMLLAGHDNQALEEVLIIASAISVQDPRERPIDAQQQADQAHRRFADEKSDFLSWIKLWKYMQEKMANKESNRLLEQEFRRNYLSSRRLREWRDVYRQLREMCLELGWRLNTTEATYEQLHKALMTGLLGSLGNRVLDADFRTPPYLGARGIKFWPWPGSFLAKKAGKWIMSAEIVETSRLFARTIANVEPEWIEAVGSHLLKKSWSEPHWEKKAGNVVALEKGTLYGLPVYTLRKVNFAPHDAKLARELFIREALVQGDFESRAPFWQHNQALIREIQELEHKSRRPDVLVDEQMVYDFYDQRLSAEVCSVKTLDAWRGENEKKNPKILYLTRKDLMRHDASGITIEYFPKKIEMAGITMALNYNFEPGSPRDGVTLTVPLFALNQIDEVRLQWLVPGMVKEKVQALLKSLPQRYRRHFVPLPEWAKQFALKYETPSGDLYEKIIEEARSTFRLDMKRSDFKTELMAPHLFINYKVVDEHGRQLGMNRSLPQLKSELGAQARETFQNIAAKDAQVAQDLQDRIVDWSFGVLPDVMEIQRKGVSLIGHPAIVDQGEYCSIEVFDDPEQAARLSRLGIRKLVKIQLKEQIKYMDKGLKPLQTTQMQASAMEVLAPSFDSFEDLKQQIVEAAIEQIMDEEELPQNAEQFENLCRTAKSKLNLLGLEIGRMISSIVSEAAAVQKKLNGFKAYPAVQADIVQQLRDLFPKRFVQVVPFKYLRHYARYLKAIAVRLDKLRANEARDAEKMADIAAMTTPYKRELAKRKGVADPRLDEFGNLLQELRVSLFAQELRTPMPVSVKRLTKVWFAVVNR